jgi:hypothetical protein
MSQNPAYRPFLQRNHHIAQEYTIPITARVIPTVFSPKKYTGSPIPNPSPITQTNVRRTSLKYQLQKYPTRLGRPCSSISDSNLLHPQEHTYSVMKFTDQPFKRFWMASTMAASVSQAFRFRSQACTVVNQIACELVEFYGTQWTGRPRMVSVHT